MSGRRTLDGWGEFDPGLHAPETPLDDQLRILVVVGLLTSGRQREQDRADRQLISSLVAQCRDSEVTVLSIDPRSSLSAFEAYRAVGVNVLSSDAGWAAALAESHYEFSHVFLTDSGLRSPAKRRILESQPQATKILYFSTLPFRKVAALVPITPPNEQEGLEYARVQAEAALVQETRFADEVWCEQEQDATFIVGLLPGTPVRFIPPVVEALPKGLALGERHGVALVATEGHDVLGGNEDAALLAMNEILPQLQRRGCAVTCTLVSDWPSPMLEEGARRHGVTIVGSRDLASTLGKSRVVLITHNYGTGGGAILHAALGARIPFVATTVASAGMSLEPLEPLAVRGALADVVQCARRLLVDDGAWHGFVGLGERLCSERYSVAARATAVRAALPNLGIVPRHATAGGPRFSELHPSRRALRPVAVALRPEGTPEPPEQEGPGPTDQVERYAQWCARYGPNPAALVAIEADIRNARHRPLISILMPVYNTTSSVLMATLDSVRAQVYDNWQLCIADDGSDREETLRVLASVGTDPRIVVTRLGGQSGISAATNAALELANGEWITLLDHDDLLKPHALAQVIRWLNADPDLDVIYSDEDKLDDDGRLVQPHLKPDWSPDQLMSQNYVCHLTVARRSLVEELGGLRSEFDGSQDYDLILRLADKTDRIGHIPEPLYTWRMVAGSTAVLAEAKPYALVAGRRALNAALERRSRAGRAEDTVRPGIYRTRYKVPGTPQVSIIIPTKDRVDLLRRCVDSVIDRSTYSNFEIVVLDNRSTDGETLEYLSNFPDRVIRYPYEFNYARMMNLGARAVDGDVLLFLNNDTEVITPDWIEALLEHAMRPEVGAVGGRLYFGDGRPQHEGILVGARGWATNVDHQGFWARGDIVRNVSAVTGACTMIRPDVYWAVGGNDERLRVAYNDVDICLRIRQAGLQVVYTPYAELHHYESSTRSGFEHHEDGPLYGIRWRPKDSVDPYYSPLLDRQRLFEIRV